jgi:hypothetical protein
MHLPHSSLEVLESSSFPELSRRYYFSETKLVTSTLVYRYELASSSPILSVEGQETNLVLR